MVVSTFWDRLSDNQKFDPTLFVFSNFDGVSVEQLPKIQYEDESTEVDIQRIEICIDESGSTNDSSGEGSGAGGARGGPPIDVSGSTDDSSGVGSGARGGPPQPPPSPPVAPEIFRIDPETGRKHRNKTPCIFVAEVEGVFSMLALLSRSFNLSGVEIFITGFSSSSRLLFFGTIPQNEQVVFLSALVNRYTTDIHPNPAFGGTNLLQCLQSIVPRNQELSPCGEYTVLVVSTDGVPTDDIRLANGRSTICELIKTNFQKSRLICIGAGSISGGPSGARTFASRNGRTFSESWYTPLATRGAPSVAPPPTPPIVAPPQCDISFLTDMCKEVELGVYAPATRDYLMLEAAIERSLGLRPAEMKYCCVSDSELSALPDEVTETLKASLTPTTGAFYTHPRFGSYVVFPKFQIGVKGVGTGSVPPDGTPATLSTEFPRDYEGAFTLDMGQVINTSVQFLGVANAPAGYATYRVDSVKSGHRLVARVRKVILA